MEQLGSDWKGILNPVEIENRKGENDSWEWELMLSWESFSVMFFLEIWMTTVAAQRKLLALKVQRYSNWESESDLCD